jgi:proteasome lid subunit RPN8/RPN11
MNLTEDIKQEILDHAKEESPNESCGLIIIKKGRTRYKKCKNIAELPKHTFVLATDDYMKAEEEGEIVGVVHSHPFEQPLPSDGDKIACEKSQVPWFIINPQTEKWGYCEPSGFELPYVGRKFQFGIIDCYSLVRDYFKKELDLHLKDYYRVDEFWKKGQNLYEDNFMNEGFRKVP